MGLFKKSKKQSGYENATTLRFDDEESDLIRLALEEHDKAGFPDAKPILEKMNHVQPLTIQEANQTVFYLQNYIGVLEDNFGSDPTMRYAVKVGKQAIQKIVLSYDIKDQK